MIRSVAFLSKGDVYLPGELILLQEWPEGDSQRQEGMPGKSCMSILLVRTGKGEVVSLKSPAEMGH